MVVIRHVPASLSSLQEIAGPVSHVVEQDILLETAHYKGEVLRLQPEEGVDLQSRLKLIVF